MTNAEAIKVLLNEWKCIDRNDGIRCNRKCESCDLVMDSAVLKDAYNLAIKAIEAQEWIPCSERLPEKSGQYYVSGGNKVWICEFLVIPNFTGGWCNDVANPMVQAWMPCNIPEPYKEGGAV